MNYNKKSIEDIDLAGKRVIARCDFNVPQDKSGAITDDNRIVQALPTIKYMVEKGCKVVLCSHLGKPHNVFDKEIKLNKKEVAAIEKLPEAEREAATASALSAGRPTGFPLRKKQEAQSAFQQ